MPMASATAVPRSFSASEAGVIRGYHMYQTLWTPYVREKPTTEENQETNTTDPL